MELTEYILIKYFYTTIYGYILQWYMKAEVYCPFKQLPFLRRMRQLFFYVDCKYLIIYSKKITTESIICEHSNNKFLLNNSKWNVAHILYIY